jgi:hypothetical protein
MDLFLYIVAFGGFGLALFLTVFGDQVRRLLEEQRNRRDRSAVVGSTSKLGGAIDGDSVCAEPHSADHACNEQEQRECPYPR